MNQLIQTVFAEEKETFENPISFWKQQLNSANPLLKLPYDHPKSPATLHNDIDVSFSLSANCYNTLKQLSSALDINISSILLAVYNTLLFRYTSQETIIMGFPCMDSGVGQTSSLTDTLPCTKLFRVDLSGNPTFNELLKRVNKNVSMVNNYKAVHYEILDEAVKEELGTNYVGLYNTTFSHIATVSENDLKGANVYIPKNFREAVDLALAVNETKEELNCIWTYNEELFEAATVKRIAKHFEILLDDIISNPERPVSQLRLLTETELLQLTSGWNSSKIAYPTDKCIYQLFEAQALNTPQAKALVFEEQQLTYAELNERANQLAHYLRARGIHKETLVPLCIGRSLEMIIGILGILKAGGAYVPVDPNYPSARTAYLLKDTKAALVLCDNESKRKLATFTGIEFIDLNDSSSFLKDMPVSNLNIDISSDNLAYIIYTSGSTGEPKGVMVEHRSVTDHCYGVIESAGLQRCKSFALFSPLVFDAGHSLIHSSLILGACLHVLSEEVIMNAENVATYVDNNAIDCIKIVPSLWLSYANLQKTVLPKKVIIFGGEVFNLSILNCLMKVNYSGNVFNHYGPTEVTIGKCIYKVNINKAYHTVPIGKPFSNTILYILDEHFQLTPVGIEGELYVAGDGLARGYLNQPHLTDEKFMQNPFDKDTSDKMYKTGDKVRWLSNGNIEYLGRADDQVKIQGHRIELGEIEDALLQSESVCNAVVLAIADKKGNKRLVAYIVSVGLFDKETITSFLRERLQEYMVPVTFIELVNLPLTGNGKINKKELENLAATHKAYIAPRNEIEKKLVLIWRDVLDVEKISIDDNFFELGGNSIDAAVLFARIKKKFNRSFPIAFIFTAPTICQLAAAINAKTKSSASLLVPIQPKGKKTPLFCVHAGYGDVLFYGNLSLHLGQDQPFYGIQAKGINGIETPSLQMEEMANHYINEIRAAQPEGPYFLAGYCLGAHIAFEMAQQLTKQGQKVAMLANFNGMYPNRHYTNPSNDEVVQISPKRASKTSLHLNNIANLSLKKKVLYVLKKIGRKVYHELRKLYHVLFYALYSSGIRLYVLVCILTFKTFHCFKQKVPGAVARMYVAYRMRKLQSKYKPNYYVGSMIIFRSPGIYKDPNLGWKNFVKGGTKTFDIPGTHHSRRDIMNEPSVQVLAEELKNFLEK